MAGMVTSLLSFVGICALARFASEVSFSVNGFFSGMIIIMIIECRNAKMRFHDSLKKMNHASTSLNEVEQIFVWYRMQILIPHRKFVGGVSLKTQINSLK